MKSLCLAHCVEAVQLALSCLSGGIALNLDAHSICFREGVSSASSYTTFLELPPSFSRNEVAVAFKQQQPTPREIYCLMLMFV